MGDVSFGESWSARRVVWVTLLVAVVLPGGLGWLLVWVGTKDEQWGAVPFGLAIVVLPAALVFWSGASRRRFHALHDGLKVTSAFATVDVAYSEIIQIRPARFEFPAVCVLTARGATFRMWRGSSLESMASVVIARSPNASVTVPIDDHWLRRRRRVWRAVELVFRFFAE